MNPQTFEQLREQITQEITRRMGLLNLPQGETGFTLIDGFFNFPVTNVIDGTTRIGGPTVPMVCIMGNTSGRVFFFPLNVLVPPTNE